MDGRIGRGGDSCLPALPGNGKSSARKQKFYVLDLTGCLTTLIAAMARCACRFSSAETLQTRLGKLLPWNWMSDRRSRAAA